MSTTSTEEDATVRGMTTFDLFAASYLDSEWETPAARRRELARRGFVAPLRWLVHLVVFLPGLGWSYLAWWEWVELTPWDLAFGWSSTLVAAGLGLLCLGMLLPLPAWPQAPLCCLGIGLTAGAALIWAARKRRGGESNGTGR